MEVSNKPGAVCDDRGYSRVIHELQKESAYSVGFLTDSRSRRPLSLQQSRTDNTIEALRTPSHPQDPKISEGQPFDGLDILRERVLDRSIDAASVSRAYARMDARLLDDVGRIGKWGLDSETKDWMYAHLPFVECQACLERGARPAQHRLGRCHQRI